jgi:hypothetical protein
MSDAILRSIIVEHLPYEIDMLRSCFQKLKALADVDPASETQEKRICRCSLIEAFCVHARSLLNFFADTKRTNQTDAIASDFTTGYDPAFDLTLNPLRTKLNKQLFHLTTDRTTVTAEKFDVGKDGLELLKYIEPAIKRFTNRLTPDFQDFKCQTPPVDFIAALPFASVTAVI